jgi:hypothetical protein
MVITLNKMIASAQGHQFAPELMRGLGGGT